MGSGFFAEQYPKNRSGGRRQHDRLLSGGTDRPDPLRFLSRLLPIGGAIAEQSPPGQLIEANSYYAFSSVFFYANRTALLLNGRYNNLEYGSYAPDAPDVFIDDNRFTSLWTGDSRWYLLAYGTEMPHLETTRRTEQLARCSRERGNYLLTNRALP